MKLNQVKVDYPRVPNQYQAADPFDVETPFDLNQTMDFIGRDLFAYVTEIKDPEVSAILCTVAQEKVRQCFGVIDQLVKLAWVASNTMPDFATTFKAAYQTVDTPARKDLSLAYAKSASSEIKLFTDFVQKLGSYKQSKDKVEGEFHAELKLANNLTIQSIAEQIQELVDYNQHTIRRKNFKRRAIPPPSVQPLSECYRKKEYDYIHKEKVNCVDICPFSRLLASGSSDGTIKFVDLDDLTIFSELTIQEPGKKGIFSLCIDDKHNLAYVNEDNLLRIMSLSTNHCIFKHQGLPLQELTDEIPDQAVQFTTDYRHLVFRNGARQIIFVLMSGLRVEKKLTTEDKIRDFSISPACDYLATASYEALQTEVYETTGGQLVSRLKFDGPIFTVQWAPNGVHAVYGGGNGKVYLVEFAKFHDKSLRVIHTFEGLFSISSNVAAVSVSHDSQYAAVGARNGDYRVKVINLWERCEQFALPADLHTFNVQGVRLSKNGKILATCSEDTTVKALLLR